MAITNLTNANTFGQWLSTTQALVTLANTLTDGPSFTANTTLVLTHAGETLNVANTATFTGNVAITGSGWGLNVSNSVYVGGDLLVGGNVVLDTIGFDNLSVAGDASITGNTTLTTLSFTTGYANTGSLQIKDTTVTNTANVNILTGNAVNQFDAAGMATVMAIALG